MDEEPSENPFAEEQQQTGVPQQALIGGENVINRPIAGESDDVCEICKEPFEQYWDEEEEEWHLENAIRVGEKTYHPVCFQDVREPSQSALVGAAEEQAACDEVFQEAEEAAPSPLRQETVEPALMEEDPSPKEECFSPMEGGLSPKEESVSPMEGGLSPKQESLSPKDESQLGSESSPQVLAPINPFETEERPDVSEAASDVQVKVEFVEPSVEQHASPEDEAPIDVEPEPS